MRTRIRTVLRHRGAIGSSPMAKADLQGNADRPVHLIHKQLAKRVDPVLLKDRVCRYEALRCGICACSK
jgi:hypothetical protein